MLRVFAEAYLCFLVSAKKNAEAIEFLRILKNYFPSIKIYIFSLKKKEIFCLIEKGIFIFYTVFKLS